LLALPAGALLSASGFCAISAARQVFGGPRPMLLASLVLIASYAAVLAAGGAFRFGFEAQPIAHGEWLWNTLALALLGLCGALAGGCPVRQIAMSGEGNGDAFVTTMGILLGGAIAHGLGLASSASGTTAAGRVALVIGLVLVIGYGAGMARLAKR
jgi:YedE family putative selenium metabolism protein